MKNKIALAIVCVFVIVGLAGCLGIFIQPEKAIWSTLVNIGENGGFLSALLMMLLNGSFIKTTLGIIVVTFCFTTQVGIALHINHWLGSNNALLLSLIGILIVYSKWFFLKKSKTRLDMLKYIWLLTFFISNYFYQSLHKISRFEYHFILDSLLLLVFLDFLNDSIREKKLFY
jgi:hypothetical protein